MKNILDKKFYVMLLGLLFFAPACTDLEEELYSDVTDENFFQTDDEFISALGGAYSSFYGIGNHSNLWSSNELSSDELVVTHKGVTGTMEVFYLHYMIIVGHLIMDSLTILGDSCMEVSTLVIG